MMAHKLFSGSIVYNDDGFKQNKQNNCRGRFIAPIADLSAFGGIHDILIMLLIHTIGPWIKSFNISRKLIKKLPLILSAM
jgi:hypothetical protein